MADETRADETRADETRNDETRNDETRDDAATGGAAEQKVEEKKGPGPVVKGTNAARTQLARAVRIISVVLATILALGALLVVLKTDVNQDNPIVTAIIDLADAVSGPFGKDNGIFDFSGKNAEAKDALVNWGIAAIVYLAIGRVVANLISPKAAR